MNYVMVDQQFGVDLTKQRLGLFKIVWLLNHSSKLKVDTGHFFHTSLTQGLLFYFFKAYSKVKNSKVGSFLRAPEDFEGLRSRKE